MSIYYAVLATVLVGAAVAVAVHLIRLITDARKTLQEVDALARKANGEMDKVQNVTAAVSNVAGAVGGSMGRTMVSVANLAFQTVMHLRKKRSKNGAGLAGDVEEEAHERK
jgi:hypothetical protein